VSDAMETTEYRSVMEQTWNDHIHINWPTGDGEEQV
jgi:uncharacterized protein YqjF (DUF2071 family)